MKALVTGSGGFLGRHFTAELKRRGWHVVDGWELARGADVMHLFRSDTTLHVDLVVHCAAQGVHRVAIDTQPASHVYNRMLDAAMFDWAIRTGVGRVLYPSSCVAFDDEPDDYGLVKLAGERMAQLARRAGLPVSVVRPYSGYGEDQGPNWPFGAFVGRAKRREDPFELWNGAAVRDWIHVDDVVAGALAVVESGTEETVSLCTGVGTSCADVAALVTKAAGYEPQFVIRGGTGANYRVGDPTALHQYYKPAVSLAEGVERALQ